MHRALLSAVLSLSVLLSPLVAAQDTEYTFTPIDVPGASTTVTFDLNDVGHVVGYYQDTSGYHGFLYDTGTFTPIDVPGDVPGTVQTVPSGINNSGEIVGLYQVSPALHGFLYAAGVFTPLDVPFSGATITRPNGINDDGQIVGNYDVWGGGTHGFLYAAGVFTPLDVPFSGATSTDARSINNSGEIVGVYGDASGTHGFLYAAGVFTPLDVPGAIYTFASGINDDGQIVGEYYDDSSGAHGFLYTAGVFTPLDVPFPGAMATMAHGINNHGQIVGRYTFAFGGQHSFLATPISIDTTPPLVTVSASPETLWPPNGQRVTVTVSGTMTDSGGSEVNAGSATYVVMDEYGQVQPKGNVTLKSDGSYAFTISLQASRNGNDRDGRHYTIAVSVKDNAGNLGVKSTIVTVPRDQS